jgi:hypothetical protein
MNNNCTHKFLRIVFFLDLDKLNCNYIKTNETSMIR